MPDQSWDDVAQDFQQAFPDLDPAQMRQRFTQAQELGRARDRATSPEYEAESADTGPLYALRRSIPFMSAIGNFADSVRYGRARQRFDAGNPEDSDYTTIARHERLQQQDEERGLGGRVAGALAHIPAIAGEAYLGGAALRGLGMAAPAAAQTPSIFSRAGLQAAAASAGRTAISPAAYGRVAAQTAAMPSMWLPEWAENNIQAHRDPLNWRGAPPAFAMGMANTAVLGSLGMLGDAIPGRSIGTYVMRGVVRTGTGMVEQQAVDAAAQGLQDVVEHTTHYSLGLNTRYGLIGDLVRGNDALGHAVIQGMTFAVFAGMHEAQHSPTARHHIVERAMDRVVQSVNEMAEHGLTREQAAQAIIEHLPAQGPQPGLEAMPPERRPAPAPPAAAAETRPTRPDLPPGTETWPGTGTTFERTETGQRFRNRDGETFEVSHRPSTENANRYVVSVKDASGEVVHSMSFERNRNGSYSGEVAGKPAKGDLTRAMYDYANANIGTLTRAKGQTKEGKQFWDKAISIEKLKSQGLTTQQAKDALDMHAVGFKMEAAVDFVRERERRMQEAQGAPTPAPGASAPPMAQSPSQAPEAPAAAAPAPDRLAGMGRRTMLEKMREAQGQRPPVQAQPSAFEQLMKDDYLMRDLDPRERQIVSRRLGDRNLSLDDLGREMGLTRERVRQLEKKGLEKLQESLSVAKQTESDIGRAVQEHAERAERADAVDRMTNNPKRAAKVQQDIKDAIENKVTALFKDVKKGEWTPAKIQAAAKLYAEYQGELADAATIRAARRSGQGAGETHQGSTARPGETPAPAGGEAGRRTNAERGPGGAPPVQRPAEPGAGAPETAPANAGGPRVQPGAPVAPSAEAAGAVPPGGRAGEPARAGERPAARDQLTAAERQQIEKLVDDKGLDKARESVLLSRPAALEHATEYAAEKAARPERLSADAKAQIELARENGFPVSHLHGRAADLAKLSVDQVAREHELRSQLASEYPQFQTVKARERGRGGDYDKIKGFDEAADVLGKQYPDLLGTDPHEWEERLFALMLRKRPEPLTQGEAYALALRHMHEEASALTLTPEESHGAFVEANREVQALGERPYSPQEVATAGDLAHETVAREALEGPAETGEGAAVGPSDADESAGRAAGSVIRPDTGDIPGGEFIPFRHAQPSGFPEPVSGAERRTGAVGTPQIKDRPARETALANEFTDAQRRQREVDEIAERHRLANETVWNQALEAIRADPSVIERTVSSLESSPRPASVEEDGILLQRRIALTNEHDRAMLARANATEQADFARRGQLYGGQNPAKLVEAERVARNHEADLREQLDRLDRVIVATGTQQGRALQFRAQMAKLDYSLSGMMRGVETAGKPLTQKERDAFEAQIRELHTKISEAQAKLDAAEKALKESGKGSKAPNYPAWIQAQVATRAAQGQYTKIIGQRRWEAMSLPERALDVWRRLRIMEVISSPITAGKVGAASVWQTATPPVRELIGSVLRLTPGIRQIAQRAPVEGRGFSLATEATAGSRAVTTGVKDGWETIRTGRSELDVRFGEPARPRSWIDFIGELHAAEKAPAVRGAYERSFRNIEAFEREAGRDVTSPAALEAIGARAYQEGVRAKFQQDNALVEAIDRGIANLKRGSTGAKILGHTADLLLPVRRTPTNIVVDALEHVFGLPVGAGRAGIAWAKGLESLTPQQADATMRMLKKGTLGIPLLMLGYFLSKNAGGFYSGRRKADDIEAGEIRVGNLTIPAFATAHHPVFMALQLGATIHRAKEGSRTGDVGLVGGTTHGLWNLFEEVPVVREQTELSRMGEQLVRGHGDRAAGGLARSFFEPQFLQWLAGRMDTPPPGNFFHGQPQHRVPHDFTEQMEMGLPGLRPRVPMAQR